MADRLAIDSDDLARKVCADLRIDGIEALRHGNGRKALSLALAQACQVLGIVCFVLTVWIAHR